MIKKVCALAILVGVITVMTTWSIQAQQAPPAAGAPGGGGGGGARGGAGGGRGNVAQATVMIKPGLSMVTGAGANSLVRVTNDGIVVVNTKQLGQMYYDAFMEQIKMISDKPVKYAVVGDVHQDKSGNTALFVAAGVQVVAHVNMKEGLKTYTNAAGTPGPPNVTYDKDYSIKLGATEVAHVYYFGKASTGGDSITYFPDLKVVSMGDVFQAGINCDYGQGGSILEWPKTLEAVLKLDFDTVIPNTGMPATRADLQATHDRLAKISAATIEQIKKGTAKDQLVAAVNAMDPTFRVDSFLMNNPARLDAYYEEFAKAAK
jgi:hypothetical protein